MAPHDPARAAEASAWLIRASQDLRAAAHGMTAEPPLLDDVVFHCQQAVERALKAFLAWHDQPFRKTHDLGAIGEQCVEIDNTLEPLLRQAAPLTEYAWKFRYPGEPEEPSIEEAAAALSIAQSVAEAVTDRFPEDPH